MLLLVTVASTLPDEPLAYQQDIYKSAGAFFCHFKASLMYSRRSTQVPLLLVAALQKVTFRKNADGEHSPQWYNEGNISHYKQLTLLNFLSQHFLYREPRIPCHESSSMAQTQLLEE